MSHARGSLPLHTAPRAYDPVNEQQLRQAIEDRLGELERVAEAIMPETTTDGALAVFADGTGAGLEAATTTGIVKATNGVPSAASQGVDYYAPGGTDVAIADGGTGASTVAVARTNLGLGVSPPQGRLTLTTATPITAVDVTAATTIYYTPHVGNQVPIYDGTNLMMTTFAELSQATTDSTKSPAAVGADSNYDLFVWNDGGTVRCTRGPAWSSATLRGAGAGTTQLEYVNGILVNKFAITNGPDAQRGTYVGTVRSTAASQIEDSNAKRFVWNAYNRASRGLQVQDATASWTYSTATMRQANNSTANQVAVVRGFDHDVVDVMASQSVSSSTATYRLVRSAIGLDSTTSGAADSMVVAGTCSSTDRAILQPRYVGLPGAGYHYLAWLEMGDGTDTQTWRGSTGGTVSQTGLFGATTG